MIWSLQILRFIAAMMVVYLHCAQIATATTGSSGILPQEFQTVGRAGVDLFFVLSGVVIARTAPGLTWQDFAWRRIRRILPIYYLLSILAVVIAMRGDFGWRDWLATVLLWPATDVMTAPALEVGWTLCFEALFYTAAALLLAHRWWLAVIAVGFAAAFVFRTSAPILQFLGNPLILEFLLGVVIARLPLLRLGVWLMPVGATLLVMTGFVGIAPDGGTMEALAGDEGLQRLLVYGVPAAMVVYGTMHFKASPSIWTYLGDASYMIYLSHALVVSPLFRLWAYWPIHPDLIILITGSLSLLLAWRLHEAFEKPILSRLKRIDLGPEHRSPSTSDANAGKSGP